MPIDAAISVQKRELRRAVVQQIRSMPRERRNQEEAVLLERFETLPGLRRARVVLLYASVFPEEIPTQQLIELVRRRGQVLVCPRVDRVEHRLRLHVIEDPERDFQSGMMRIPEPTLDCPELPPDAIDWALVPGLAFDRAGYRLGRGGGYYDRLLPKLRPSAPRWAIALSPQWFITLPHDLHDSPVDGVLCAGGGGHTFFQDRADSR